MASLTFLVFYFFIFFSGLCPVQFGNSGILPRVFDKKISVLVGAARPGLRRNSETSLTTLPYDVTYPATMTSLPACDYDVTKPASMTSLTLLGYDVTNRPATMTSLTPSLSYPATTLVTPLL